MRSSFLCRWLALLLAWALYAEPVAWPKVLGGCLIIVGIVVIRTGSAEKRPPFSVSRRVRERAAKDERTDEVDQREYT